jgi:WD40 repeat protein
MLRAFIAGTSVCFALLNVLAVCGQENKPAPKVRLDPLGDPLPKDALMRFGSSRLFSGGSPGSTLRFSEDGRLLAWAGSFRHVCLYRVKDGKAVLTIDKGNEPPGALTIVAPLVEIAPGGKYLAFQSRTSGVVRLWDVAEGKQAAQTAAAQQATALAFAPDGSKLAAGSNQGQVHVYEVPTLREIATFKGRPGRVWCVRFTPDGKRLWCGDGNDIVEWNIQTKKRIREFQGHTSLVFCLEQSPDSKTLASGSQDHTIRLWDLATGKTTKTLTGHDDGASVRGPHQLSFLAGGKKLLSVAGDRTVRLWDLAAGTNEVKFKTPAMPDLFFAVSADGKLAARHEGNFIDVFDLATGKSVTNVPGHRSQVRSVAWSADGKHVATGGLDKTVRVWDAKTGQEKRNLPGSELSYGTVFFLPDNKTLLASGCNDPLVHVWDITTGKKLRTIPRVPNELMYKNSFFYSGTLAVSKDGKLMASATSPPDLRNPNLAVMDVQTGKPVRIVVNLPGAGFARGGCVAFTPDSKAVVLGSHAHSNLIDVATGNVLQHILFHADVVAVSPKGDKIALRGNLGLLACFDAANGNQLYLAGVPATGGGSSAFGHALACSPDGKYLATASGAVIFLHEPATGKVVRELRGHLDSVQALAFSADGQKLLSGSDDGTALIWDLRGK